MSKRVKKIRVSKNVCTRPRVKKQNLRFRVMFRVKTCQNVSKNWIFDTPDSFKWLPDASKWLPGPYKSWPTGSKSVKPCQKVSENDRNVRKHNVFGECQNVSKRVKKWSRVKTCQNVSKSVKKVSKKCQKRVKTCQNVSKNSARSNVSCQNVSKNQLFDTFFDTHFCLLGVAGFWPHAVAQPRPGEAALVADLITASSSKVSAALAAKNNQNHFHP